ncbi:unnamed protein product [Trichobilharzia szidati]|nr:unnamed protein product [Trichobilharzia szidati]
MLPMFEEIGLNCPLQNETCLFKLYDESPWSLDGKTDSVQMNGINTGKMSKTSGKTDQESLTSLVNKINNDNQEAPIVDSLDEQQSWHSTSPCSSESADSFSSNSRNDLRSYLEGPLSPEQSTVINSRYTTHIESLSSDLLSEFMTMDTITPMNILSIPNHFENTLDPSLFYADYIKNTHDNYYSNFSDECINEMNNDQLESSKEGTSNSNEYCTEEDLLKLYNNNNRNERDSNSGTSQRSRPLSMKSVNDKPHVTESPPPPPPVPSSSSSFTDNFGYFHSPNELASEDIAWMDTLDVSGLGLDDVEQIFSTVNSPEEEINKSDHYCTVKSHSSSELQQSSSTDQLSNQPVIISKACKSSIGNDLLHEAEQIGDNMSDTERVSCNINDNNNNLYHEDRYNDEHNSDSTLTCSEAEYHTNLLRQKRLKKHRLKIKAKSRHNNPCTSSDDNYSDSSFSDDHDDEESLSSEVNYRPEVYYKSNTSKRFNHSVTYGGDSASYRNKKHQSYCCSTQSQATDINDCEPWWPNPVTRRMHKDFQSAIWITNSTQHADDDDYHGDDRDGKNNHDNSDKKRSTKTKLSPATHEVHNSDSERSNSSMDQFKSKHHRDLQHHSSYKCLKSSKYKKHRKFSTSSVDSHWLTKRKCKQMELWQFILCRLETGNETTAFQWVNRSTGIFRIVNTQLSAKEWGHYRNNKHMDYEKMARAMRFYYKDSILRKSRQQLHFQFAMPYVQWAEKFYRDKK